jgi:hypothetical protein
MAKLYAELTSDKGGRVASKGGDDFIMVTINHKNSLLWEITAGAHGRLKIRRGGKTYEYTACSLNWPDNEKLT